MTRCFAYIRVSTAKQGEKGVSLQEQRAAIERYVSQQGIELVSWFEERETAAKRGRPVFSRMLKQLRAGRADGVVIHKIDRSARNLRDWADLGELIDRGIAVHFVNESLDLATRGGRLSADIQAVVAADYIRNLREEARKGFAGRLKQGLYPLRAPLGYLDNGGGRPKTIDPERGPLVRRAFELYSTGRYSLRSLAVELQRLGLRKRNGSPLTATNLSLLFNLPFYTGTIRIKRTGEVFEGVHEPLVTRSLFQRVQSVLSGKTNTLAARHDFVFRRLFDCGDCGRKLIGEIQKGHTYYRCHNPDCPMKCIREEAIEVRVRDEFERLSFSAAEKQELEAVLAHLDSCRAEIDELGHRQLDLLLARNRERLTRLTDAFLDGAIDVDAHRERREGLLTEREQLEERIAALNRNQGAVVPAIRERLELADRAWLSYQMGSTADRRELVERLTSNRTAGPSGPSVELSFPFRDIARRRAVQDGGPCRDIPRTEVPKLPPWEDLHSMLLTRRETPIWVASMLGPMLDWVKAHTEQGDELEDVDDDSE